MKVPRKSLRGYEVKAVQETYEQLQLLHEQRMAGLAEELQMLKREYEKLQQELDLLSVAHVPDIADKPDSTDKSDKPDYIQAAEQEMMEAHLEQTRRIVRLAAELEALQERQEQELAAKHEQRAAVLERIQARLANAFAQLQPKEG